MKPDEGKYLPTSRACAHMRPHAVPAVVLSPLRAALDRSCPSAPHLRLPHPSACSRSSLLKYPPFPSLPSTDLRRSSSHSLAPFPASTCVRAHLRYAPHSTAPAYPPALPLLQALCLSREGEEGAGVWNPLSTLGLLSAGENVQWQQREEAGGEYLRQVSGKYGTASTGVRG
jgi:hypothetical protein